MTQQQFEEEEREAKLQAVILIIYVGLFALFVWLLF